MDTAEGISNMDALLFALILEVALLQIRILEGSTELRARCWRISNKSEKLQREKLGRDRDTVKDVLSRTLIEVADNGECPTLRKAVGILIQRASSAVSMRLQYEELLKSRDGTVQELEEKRSQWVMQLRDADHRTAMLRDKINDEQLNANVRLVYAEKWVAARAESLELQWQQPRTPPPNMDHEERVHQELLKAYEMQIKNTSLGPYYDPDAAVQPTKLYCAHSNCPKGLPSPEREESLAHWEQRYATDTVNMNARLVAKREQFRVATVKHEELQKLFDLHEGEMRSWLNFKRERAARLAREERVRMSATRIQAWWRGTMVRRGLGAFRFMRNLKKTPSKKKK